MSQLSDPFNVNFIGSGRESNGQWSPISLSSTTPASPLIQNWSSVAVSTDGQFVIACVNEGQVFTSSNYGYSMVPDTSLPSAAWSDVSISCDGTKAAACINNGGIYIATLNTTTLNWTWTLTGAPTAAWSSISFSVETISVSGGYQIVSNWIAACINNPTASSGTYGIYYSESSGTNWYHTNALAGDWSSITYLNLAPDQLNWVASMYVTGEIYLSYSNNPNDWNLLYEIGNCSCVSSSGISSSGTNNAGVKIFACSYNNPSAGIVIGTYSNSTWTWINSQGNTQFYPWTSIACNSTGQYVVACKYTTSIYCSFDYGITWRQQLNGLSNSNWKCVASDSSGSFLVGAVSGGNIYISPYFQGIQWNSSNGSNLPWNCVASDSTGQNLIACTRTESYTSGGVNYGNVYISNDYGINWVAQTTNLGVGDWISVASSGNGSVLAAVINSGIVYLSVDYGASWTLQTISTASEFANCNQIAIDNSGTYAVVCSYYTNNTPTQSGAVYVGILFYNTWTWTKQTITLPEPSGNISWTSITTASNNIYVCGTSTTVANNGIWRGTQTSNQNVYTFAHSYDPGYELYFYNIRCSSSGQYVIACNVYATAATEALFYSSNYCIPDQSSYFIPSSAFPTGMPPLVYGFGFRGATMDTTGLKIAVTYYGPSNNPLPNVYVSTDINAWIAQSDTTINTNKSQITGLPVGNSCWQSISCNNNMDRLIVCAGDTVQTSYTIFSIGIFTSFISQTSWTPQLNALPTFGRFTKLTSSSSGQYLAVASQSGGSPPILSYYGGIWISSDSGSTWIQSTAGNYNWDAIASDNTGQYLVAGVFGGSLYTSSNYGYSWTIVTSLILPSFANWSAISFSCNSDPNSNSQVVYAQAYGGNLYYSYTRGTSDSWVSAPVGVENWSNGMGSSSNGYYANAGTSNSSTGVWKLSNYGTVATQTTPVPYTGFSTNWNYVATDKTGQYVVAVYQTSGGNFGYTYYGIYFSSDFGSNWSQIVQKTLNWNAITLVNTGSELLVNAIASNSLIYSGTYNITTPAWIWTFKSTTLPSSNWNDLQTSSDGTKLVLCSITGGIWTSTNNGTTWTQSTSFYTNYNTAITSSSTGQNLAAIINNGTIYTSSNYGSTWSQLTSNTLPSFTNWYTITSSITGQYIVASTLLGEIFVSSNYGQTWITSIIGANPVVSISSSGQYVVAATYLGTIYISSNYGVAWSQLTEEANGLPSVSEAWSAIAMSCTGQYIAATINGGTIYISSNFGSNWSPVSLTPSNWSSIAISDSGQNIVAAINGGTIYFSSDFGSIWTAVSTTANGLPSTAAWSAVAISGTGQYMFATINGNKIYYSSSYGTIWIEGPTTADGSLPPTAAWTGITSSTSGQYLAAIAPNSNSTTDIYIYSNFMDIGNIFGSLINQLQILAQKQN